MSNQIEEYRVESFAIPGDLSKKVVELLKQGFELYGTPFSRDRFICQALVKRKPEVRLGTRKMSQMIGGG